MTDRELWTNAQEHLAGLCRGVECAWCLAGVEPPDTDRPPDELPPAVRVHVRVRVRRGL